MHGQGRWSLSEGCSTAAGGGASWRHATSEPASWQERADCVLCGAETSRESATNAHIVSSDACRVKLLNELQMRVELLSQALLPLIPPLFQTVFRAKSALIHVRSFPATVLPSHNHIAIDGETAPELGIRRVAEEEEGERLVVHKARDVETHRVVRWESQHSQHLSQQRGERGVGQRHQETVVDVAERDEAVVREVVVRGKRLVVQIHLTTSPHTLVGDHSETMALRVQEMRALVRAVDGLEGLRHTALDHSTESVVMKFRKSRRGIRRR